VQRSFINSSLYLFLDVIFISISGWLFWLIVGKYSDTQDVGIATYLYTLATFISGLALLGFEFPVIKISTSISSDEMKEIRFRSAKFGTILIFEMILNLILAALLYTFLLINAEFDYHYVVLTVSLLLFSSLGTLARYALLGTLQTRLILITDIASIILKFLAGILLLIFEYGAFAILFAAFVQTSIAGVVLAFQFIRGVGFRFERNLLGSILRDGISNYPGKISKILIAPLSIILLGLVGVETSDMGIFFISLTVSVIAGAFATSLATISLSTAHKNAVSLSQSFRFGLSLTAPLIALLIVFPKTILGLINSQYVQGFDVLGVLAIAILPSIVVFNTITKLNYQNDNRNLIIIGLVEFCTFVVTFLVLVPMSGIMAGAIAVLISYVASSLLALKILDRTELVIVMKVCISILPACLLGLLFVSMHYEIIGIPLVLSITLIINHVTGTLRFREIGEAIRVVARVN
jgi:O-antigen/teichoic acid export membrane protein